MALLTLEENRLRSAIYALRGMVVRLVCGVKVEVVVLCQAL
jgi:hypothetical protein